LKGKIKRKKKRKIIYTKENNPMFMIFFFYKEWGFLAKTMIFDSYQLDLMKVANLFECIYNIVYVVPVAMDVSK
jgi:hypothetical protein